MKVIAVVLNWRRPTDTIACVASVRETAPDVELLIIDNASDDGSVEQIRAAHPDVDLIVNDDNLGYAGGNNVGMREAIARGADAVLVLNNDLVVLPGCIKALAGYLATHEKVGIVGPLSLRGDDPTLVDFMGARVSVRDMALVAQGRDLPLDEAGLAPVLPSDYITGSALMIRSRLIETLGGFDERFFLVWEDVDLSLRAAKTMYPERGIISAARVVHARSVSFGGEASPLYWYFFVRNSFLFLSVHGRWPWRTRTLAMLERRYRTLSTAADGPVETAMGLGLRDALAGRWGRTPPELLS